MGKYLHCIDSRTRMLWECMQFCLGQHILNDKDCRIFGIESCDHVLKRYHIFCICFHHNFYNTNRMICLLCRFQIAPELGLCIPNDAIFCKNRIVCNQRYRVLWIYMGDKNWAYVICSSGGEGGARGISAENS